MRLCNTATIKAAYTLLNLKRSVARKLRSLLICVTRKSSSRAGRARAELSLPKAA